MERYIWESLAVGIIRLSSSPVGAGFFFLQKKDKNLWPCIGYWGLNQISIKSIYPLPLIISAFSIHPRGDYLYQTLSSQCLPLGQNSWGGRMEDSIQHTPRSLWVLGHVIWPHKCSFKPSLMISWEIIWNCLSLSIWMTYWSFLIPLQKLSGWYYKDSWRIASTSRLKNVSSTHPM